MRARYLLVLMGLASCGGTPPRTNFVLPCGIGPLTWGMSRAELQALRPGAARNESTSGIDFTAYTERHLACAVADEVDYRFRDDSLESVKAYRFVPEPWREELPRVAREVADALDRAYGRRVHAASRLVVLFRGPNPNEDFKAGFQCVSWEAGATVVVLDHPDPSWLESAPETSIRRVSMRTAVWFVERSAVPDRLKVCVGEDENAGSIQGRLAGGVPASAER